MPSAPRRIGLLLLPRFSLLSLASVSEVLRVADELLGGHCFERVLLSLDGLPVAAAGGEVLHVNAALDTPRSLDGLLVCSEHVPGAADQWVLTRLTQVLAEIDRRRGVIGGIGSGSAWLAVAGMLRGYRATLPVLQTAAVSAAHPDAIISGHFYEIDRNRLSCVGGNSGLDLMISWLGSLHGEALTRQLLVHFGLERLRAADERQLLPTAARLGASSKLAEAVALMESNLGEPLSTEDIAGLVGVSRRQLERLFKQHLDTLPSRWYLEQRLTRARRLLQQTAQSILQIGLSCGFSSGAHFSNAYRNCFGHTPRDERSARAAAWRAAPTAIASASGAEFDPAKDLP